MRQCYNQNLGNLSGVFIDNLTNSFFNIFKSYTEHQYMSGKRKPEETPSKSEDQFQKDSISSAVKRSYMMNGKSWNMALKKYISNPHLHPEVLQHTDDVVVIKDVYPKVDMSLNFSFLLISKGQISLACAIQKGRFGQSVSTDRRPYRIAKRNERSLLRSNS